MSETMVKGSCLCGAVEYQVKGEAVRFYHCHCQRCRKLTGTGHASNLFIQPLSALTWLKGEELLQHYKLPEAERFYNLFCKQCGSPMPRAVKDLNGILVGAGSMDCESPIPPGARIFWASRADWSCSAGGLPVFDEYPDQD